MLKIRNAESSDAKEIARIKVDTWRSAYKGILPEDYLNKLDYEEQAQRFGTLISKGKDSFVIVAELDSQIVAFAAAGKERTNEYYYEGEVYSIYVMEEHQKKGIGRQLISHAAKGLTEMGIDSMLVWALEGNPYIGFYETLQGKYIEKMPFDLVDSDLYLVGYGWKDIGKKFVSELEMSGLK